MNQPDLGHYISNLRKEQGLTQEELVEKCNINVRTIQRIEAGEVTPRSYTVKNILEALGSSFDDVFKKKNPLSERPHPLEKKQSVFGLCDDRRSYLLCSEQPRDMGRHQLFFHSRTGAQNTYLYYY